MAIRAFVAFDTPPEIREMMTELQSTLKNARADVRWEPQEKFHATIKFLGRVEEGVLPTIIATIERALSEVPPFTVTYAQLGCFPQIHRPRVVWIGGVDTDGTLKRIKDLLDTVLLPLGFERENREFRPHVTLGRVKSMKNVKALTPILQSLTFPPRIFTCREILLMRSVLRSEGSEYSLIRAFSLSGSLR